MQIKINKRSAYAPIRYEATRPYGVSIGKAFVTQAARGEKARLAFIQESLLPLLKNAVARMGSENGPGPVQAEMLNVQIFGKYNQGGRVIFDISKPLTTALLMTDADDIPCGEIAFPAKSFYLHFGHSHELTDSAFAIEGAFVSHEAGRMWIDLVPAGFGQAHFFALPMGEALIGVSIDTSDAVKPITKALSDSIAHIMERNRAMLTQLEELELQLSSQYGQVVKVPSPVERLDDKEPVLRSATALIVNALFYISSDSNDVHEGWGRDTPEDAAAALRNARNAGEARTLENTLLKAGYSKVKFVGKGFAASSESQAIEEAVRTGKHLATHFRRGHYRRQPYGPERSLRKRIFVAPVMVNATGCGEPPGRIYDVE